MNTALEVLKKHLKVEWIFGGESGKAILAAMEEYKNQPTPQPTIEQEGKSKESLELYMEALLTWIGDNHIQFTDGEWYHKDDADGDNPIPEKELVSQFVFRNPIPLESIKSQPSPAPLPNGFTREDMEKAYKAGWHSESKELYDNNDTGFTQFLNTLKR